MVVVNRGNPATNVNAAASVSPVLVTVTDDVKGVVGARTPDGAVTATTTFAVANAESAITLVAVVSSAARPMIATSCRDRTDMCAPLVRPHGRRDAVSP